MKKIISIGLICLLLISIFSYRAELKAQRLEKLNTQIEKEIKKPKPEQKIKPKGSWKPLGKQRITTYCPICNDPPGYKSKSGKELQYGYVACNWLPIGAKISIEGEIFYVMDTCGTEAIDIFIDTDECTCNLNEYKEVSIYSGDELE